MSSLIDIFYKISKLKERENKLFSEKQRFKKIISQFKKDKKTLLNDIDKKNKDIDLKLNTLDKNKEKIYYEVLKDKQDKNEVIVLKSIIITPFSENKYLLGIIPYKYIPFLNTKERYKTMIEYYDNSNTKQYIGIDKTYTQIIDLFKKEKYIIGNENETNKLFYKGKRIFSIKNDIPINLSFKSDSYEFFADPKVFHDLVNNVFDHKLTIPTKNNLDVFDWIKKNWIIILFIIVAYYLYQSGQLNQWLG